MGISYIFELFLALVVLSFALYIFKKLLRLKTKEIQRRMTQDTLTGYGTRYKLIQDLDSYHHASLAIVNIDNFREINDFFGHELGDTTILEVANLLHESVKELKETHLYHLQGDEFAILCEHRNEEFFLATIKNLLTTLANKNFYIHGEEISLGATAGISFFKESSKTLATADIALKNAKRKKLDWSIYSEQSSLHQEYKNNLTWTKKLKLAIKENRIEPYFQAIVCNKTLKVVKYEALVRLIDEDANVISPYHFIEIAKRTKNYITLTKIMIEKSFNTFAKEPYSFSINLTIEDILNSYLTNYLFEKLHTFEGCERIIFEIVESEGIENFKEATAFITKIKSYGCKIAIDDFGTGYSNFEYLIELQADFIKIDGSLIKNLDKDYKAQAVVSTIVSFAKKNELSNYC